MLILWGVIATYDTVAQQFFPDLPLPSIFELTYSRFPIFGWRLWVVIGLILVLVATLEGAFRKKQAFESQIHELEQQLDNVKSERPKIELTVRRQHDDFDIEVLNKGEDAEFEAQIEVLEGKGFVLSLPQNYSAYWEKTKNDKIELKKGQTNWLKIASLQIATRATLMNFRLHYYEIAYFENSTIPRIAYAESTSWIVGNTQVVKPCILLRVTVSSKPSMIDGAFIRTYQLSNEGLLEVNTT